MTTHYGYLRSSRKLKPNEMMASLDQAVQAILVGHAVNKSLATGKPVDVQDLLKKG